MTSQPDTEARPAGRRRRYADYLHRATPVMRRTALVTVLALGSTLGTPAFQTKSVEENTTTRMTVSEQSPVQARMGAQMGFIVTLDAVEPTGTIEVYSGATLLTTTDARHRAWTFVPAKTLLPGTVPLRFVYVPTGHFEGSEATVSVELDKSSITVTSRPRLRGTKPAPGLSATRSCAPTASELCQQGGAPMFLARGRVPQAC